MKSHKFLLLSTLLMVSSLAGVFSKADSVNESEAATKLRVAVNELCTHSYVDSRSADRNIDNILHLSEEIHYQGDTPDLLQLHNCLPLKLEDARSLIGYFIMHPQDMSEEMGGRLVKEAVDLLIPLIPKEVKPTGHSISDDESDSLYKIMLMRSYSTDLRKLFEIGARYEMDSATSKVAIEALKYHSAVGGLVAMALFPFMGVEGQILFVYTSMMTYEGSNLAVVSSARVKDHNLDDVISEAVRRFINSGEVKNTVRQRLAFAIITMSGTPATWLMPDSELLSQARAYVEEKGSDNISMRDMHKCALVESGIDRDKDRHEFCDALSVKVYADVNDAFYTFVYLYEK